MNVDALDAGVGDGPSAHDPLPDPDLTVPADLDDAVRSDNPAVVHDPEAPDDDQTIVGAVEEAIPANDLDDGLAPDHATIVEDDVPLDEEEQEET